MHLHKSALKALTAVIGAMIFFSAAAAFAEEINWVNDFQQGQKMAKDKNLPILVDFYTEWCGWCKKLDKDTYTDKNVIAESRGFVCVKIDAEKKPDLAGKYNVRGFPTIVFISPTGKVLATIPGYLPAKDFLQAMKNIKKAPA